MNEELKKIIAEQLNTEESTITENTRFKEDLNADSLDLFELVMAMEEEFEVEIADEDAQKILKVQDAIAYIEEKK